MGSLEEQLPKATAAFRGFMEGFDPEAPTTVLCHSDADGVATGAMKKYKAKWLREATALINAARRSSSRDAETALWTILKSSHPGEIVDGGIKEARLLWEYRIGAKAAFNKAKHAAPHFSGQVVLVCIKGPCYVHPLVARIWRNRFSERIVIMANEGYIPGYVAFSVRTSAEVCSFPSPSRRCRKSTSSKRTRMRELLRTVEKECPQVKINLLRAVQRSHTRQMGQLKSSKASVQSG